MTSPIRLAADLALPLDAVTQKFAFMGRSGSGKTYGAGKLAEELLTAGAQVVIVDPVGVWWGLRLAADGKGPGIEIPVFGGEHGDLPLDPGAGALIADLVATRGAAGVLDVSAFTGGEMRRFVTDFAVELLRRKRTARAPLMVIWEECQDFVPQRTMPESARMLGAMEKLIKQGRNFGIGTTLISQRPQAVHKDVLNQTEALLVFQLTGAHERKAINDWITDKGLDEKALGEIASLPKGHAFLWSPQWLGTFRRLHIGQKRTFDASRTPEFGAAVVPAAALSPLALDEIRAAMAQLGQVEDPVDAPRLRKRVADLERQLAARVVSERVEVQVLEPGQAEQLERAAAALVELGSSILTALRATSALPVHRDLPRAATNGVRAPVAPAHVAGLKKGARGMLAALACFHPRPLGRHQVATLAGLSSASGTFSDYLGALRRAGLVELTADPSVSGDALRITATGRELAGPQRSPQSSVELVEIWRSRMKAGARRMLDTLVAHYPHGMSRARLGEASGIATSSGTFSDYLGALRRNGLIEVERDQVRASGTLFLAVGR